MAFGGEASSEDADVARESGGSLSPAAKLVLVGAVLAAITATLSYVLCAAGLPPVSAAATASAAVVGALWIAGGVS